jgi:hypothetical protein
LQFVKLKIAIRQVENCDLSSWKLRFVKLKIAICQVENCDLPPLVQKPPNLRHTNFVIMTSFWNTWNLVSNSSWRRNWKPWKIRLLVWLTL